jgi:type IV secretory pathway TraG/TraD family ATPase VirD4
MRLAIFKTLSLGEGDSRLWFAIDELDALGAIDGLADALPRLRKFGAAARSVSNRFRRFGDVRIKL